MALRNQPYLPLYVNDFLSDEKLRKCSPASYGVYILLMCLMHKSDEYGKILLKEKFKRSANQIQNFSKFLSKDMPFSDRQIATALRELLDENVLILDGDCLVQKRMVRDGSLSDIRASAGKNGGKISATTKNICSDLASPFAQAKPQANAINEIETINESDIDNKKEGAGRKPFVKPTLEEVTQYCQERNKGVNPNKWLSYYEANGWKVGKNPMKDWKAAVRTWEPDKPKQPETKQSAPIDWSTA